MKTHLLCVGLGYWLLTKLEKTIVEDNKLENCIEEERDLFMYNVRAREALLSSSPENEYRQVKLLKTYHEIWKALESNFEGDKTCKESKITKLDMCIS